MKTEFNTTVASKKREAPFSLRLTFEERAKLETAAKGVPLGTYIKCVLFERELPKVRRRHAAPVKDHQALAQVLAALGQSRLSANLNQLARAVNTGTLPVHPETEGDLRKACAAVQDMRQVLLEAFGKDGGPP
ncbi:hypothetical protein G5B39_03950 [Rhodobacteraceae bacterium SC52]|nr:hypothetical protein G5B39_03950 [Rhodobacteraceae bacterium SC52]